MSKNRVTRRDGLGAISLLSALAIVVAIVSVVSVVFPLEIRNGPSPNSLVRIQPVPSDRELVESFIRHRRPKWSPKKTGGFAEYLIELCDEFEFEPVLILSVIDAESSFRPNAVSPMGAKGLMQLLPTTAKYVSEVKGFKFRERDLWDAKKNLRLGVSYLDYLRKRYRGNIRYMLAAYNVGPGRADWLIKKRKHFRKNPRGEYLDLIDRKRRDIEFWMVDRTFETMQRGSRVRTTSEG